MPRIRRPAFLRTGACLLLVLGLAGFSPADAQQPAGEPVPAGAREESGDSAEARAGTADALPHGELFEPLDLPAPNRYRTASGRPGPDWWQQRVDYRIRARLEPAENRVEGTQTLTYTNHSPDSLRHLWFQLDQNLFDPQSRGARLRVPDARFRGAFPGGGFDLTDARVSREGRAAAPDVMIEGTTMRLTLPEPLPPGGAAVEIELAFSFVIPERGADRTGRMAAQQGPIYQVAQWYPRPFVYDDVRGWNVLPYLGRGEWYLEYGDFEVEITVPRPYLVFATGELRNPEEVLTSEQRRRLARAATSDEPVHVVAADEVGGPLSRPAGEGELTWRFRASGVRDFAWAASPAFIWDAAGWGDVLVMSAYPREGLGSRPQPGWEASTRYARHSIRHYSEKWHPYPYPVAINVAGPVTGMEYPMIAFCTVRARGRELFAITDHEMAHMWFPMLVGSDERRHSWMDEGFASFLSHYSLEDFYGEAPRPPPVEADEIARAMGSPAGQVPITTPADRLPAYALGFASYQKPAYALLLLREHVLGPERFDPALREYIRRWANRHPQPADFFRAVEDVSGEDLDWFWRGWFLGTGTLDKALRGVETRGDTVHVQVESRGGVVMPVDVRVVFRDGSSETVRVPVEAWFTSATVGVRVPAAGREPRTVHVDPDGRLPDVDRRNNVWGRGVVGN